MPPSPGGALARALQDLPGDPGLAGERLGPFAPAFPDPGAAARRVAALRLRVSPAALPGALRAVARAADPALALAGLGEGLADPAAAVPAGRPWKPSSPCWGPAALAARCCPATRGPPPRIPPSPPRPRPGPGPTPGGTTRACCLPGKDVAHG